MSEFRIGFYVNHDRSYADDVHWLLTYDGTHFSFRIIGEELLQGKKIRKLLSLSNPVLYREDTSNPGKPIVEELVFLRDLPIRAKDELSNTGYELYAPFVERQHIANPCLMGYLCLSDFSGELLTEASVYYNGEEITRQLPGWGESLSLPILNSILFSHLVIAGVVINHICEECSSCEKYSAFLHKPYEHFYYGYDKKASHDKGISDIIQYVDSLDIADIVDSISAKVSLDWDYYRGEKDQSYYTQYIRIGEKYEFLRGDCYLSAHLRGHVIGDKGWYKEGPVDEQTLQKIKFELYKNYSKTEHVACLVAEWQSYAFHFCYYKHLWDDYFAVIEYALYSYFHLDELTRKHGKLKKNFNQELDTIYLFANREKNVQIINDGIKASTESNLTKEGFNQILSDLKANIVFVQHALNCHDLKYSYDYPPGVWHNDRLNFNYSLSNINVWPPNDNNPMAVRFK